MVMEVVDEDMDLTTMSCSDHPYKNHTPGGICAFCLQDKLGKLVSSSFPSSIFPASSSSSSSVSISISSPRAELIGIQKAITTVPIMKTKHSFKKPNADGINDATRFHNKGIVFQRSKSTAVHRQQQQRGFWSFLSLNRVRALPSGGGSVTSFRQRSLRESNECIGEEGDCFSGDDERKVSRSRSVGCGSRSFSGDFFERISTGFGDCTLRRVESQREKPKNTPVHGGTKGSAAGDKVRCGGIFGGFSSSSSSSSSTNWTNAPPVQAAHGRSRSWGWALASPMRAFTKTKRESGSNKRNVNVTPNLNAIPSLLAVGG